ncbi:MAG: hypothetical protein KC466_15930 [Myxococcales bacterium]|nr:hypothetical protein [Myxococcales bacterium]
MIPSSKRWMLAALGAAACVTGCGGGGVSPPLAGGIGSVVSAQGAGMEVDFDPDALPVPEIPLPNDVLTVPDDRTPTHKRVNIPLDSDTTFEFRLRQAINDLDGFGLTQPISVSFAGPMDMDTIRVNFDDDPTNDTIFIVNLNPDSPRFGERVEIDWTHALLPTDRSDRPFNLSIAPFDEATALARLALGGERLYNIALGIGNREPFYEDETDTILMQPALPLEDGSVYGVYLTRGLRDARGNIPRSPFRPAIALFTQFASLNRGLPILARDHGVAPQDLAFAWCFTTMSAFAELDTARMGLDGTGPLAYLPEAFPPVIETLDPVHPDGSVALSTNNIYAFLLAVAPGLLNFVGGDFLPSGSPPALIEGLQRFLDDPVEFVGTLAAAMGVEGNAKGAGNPIEDLVSGRLVDGILPEITFEHVSHIVGGVYRSPRLTDERKVFDPRLFEGTRRLDPAREGDSELVPFLLTVPKTVPPGTRKTGFDGPPFPVLHFIHPNQTERLIGIMVANRAAEYGYAVAAIDQAEHGPLLPMPEKQLRKLLERGDPAVADLTLQLLPFAMGVLNVAGFTPFPVDEPAPASIKLLDLIAEANDRAAILSAMSDEELFQAYADIPLVHMINGRGRATEDRDHDGIVENGEAFFTADLGRTRDLIRQTIVDQMQMARVVNALCADRNGNGANDPEEGDFDKDGVCDVGGPENVGNTVAMGESQGGVLGSVYLGTESVVRNGVLNVPGGSYVKIIERTNLSFVFERILREVLGPFAAAIPGDGSPEAEALGVGDGQVAVLLIDREVGPSMQGLYELNIGSPPDDPFVPYVVLDAAPETDLTTILGTDRESPIGRPIRVTNLTRNHDSFGTVGPDGRFAVGIPTDAGDEILVRTPTGEARFTAVGEGLGLPRNTARLRRFLDIAQMVIDPSDAMNYATRWVLHPPPGLPAKNVLVQTDPGDKTVPVSNQVALMRAMGVLEGEELKNVVDGNLVTGVRYLPNESDIAGLNDRLEDLCLCLDGSDRRAQCEGKEDFNEIVGMNEAWRDRTWARLSAAAGAPNYSAATFHLGGEHAYFFAPFSLSKDGKSLGAERYTLIAQTQAMEYVTNPASFTPLSRTYRAEDNQCPVDLFGSGSGELLPSLDLILSTACGSCDMDVTCDVAGAGTPVGVLRAAAGTLAWLGPLLFLAVLRVRAAARVHEGRA